MIFVMFEIVYSIFAINGLTCKVKSFDFPYNRSTWYFVSINGVGSKLKVGAGGELDLSEIFLTSIKKNVYFCINKKVPLCRFRRLCPLLNFFNHILVYIFP